MKSCWPSLASKAESRAVQKWAEFDRYDIIATADGEFSSAERGAMIMALLEDRFKLAVHHDKKEEPGIALTATRKPPPGVKPAAVGEQTLIRMDERRQIIFRSQTMGQVARYLRGLSGIPVVDNTGMTGSYDFILDPESDAGLAGAAFSDRLRAAMEAAGFRLEPIKVTRDTTVIDHVERPTEN
jgi:uncharacterized protein (TIGR03435 family)